MQIVARNLIFSATDLMNFAGCRHITRLDREVAEEMREKPDYQDPNAALLRDKGLRHEAAYIEFLEKRGLRIYTCTEQSNEHTLEAMRAGHEVITQAYLEQGNWRGRADILLRVDGRSDLGDYHYEVQDTKLSSETKGATLLQLCLYNEILAELQGVVAERIHAVKPGAGFPTDSFRYAEFQAYYTSLKKRFEAVMNDGLPETYPLPVERCQTCRWWKVCDRQWNRDDHPSRIAGAGNLQVKQLALGGYNTLEAYAVAEQPIRPERGSAATYVKLHGQAKIQLEGRVEEVMKHRLLPFEMLQGLNRLPAPSDGDVYFDIEGDRYFEGEGLEYLLGYAVRKNGKYEYTGLWAKDRKQEKAAFEEFMGFLMAQWKQYPDFHIYHYAHYEPTAIKQLSVKYNVYTGERDSLLRTERFVDLLSITKQALQASVTSYSLKEVEQLTGFTREADLRQASSTRRLITRAFDEGWMDEFPEAGLKLVEEYNKDDVIATGRLHDFLENVFQENKTSLVRPEIPEDKVSEKAEGIREENRALWEKLTTGLPEDHEEWSRTDHAKWMAANLIEYYWREQSANLWEAYSLQEKEPEEWYNDRNILTGLQFIRREQEGRKLPVFFYRFPEQEISEKISEEDTLKTIENKPYGTLVAVDLDANVIRIRKRRDMSDEERDTVIILNEFRPVKQEQSLKELLSQIAEDNYASNPAAMDLLLKSAPRLKDGRTFAQLAGSHKNTYDLAKECLMHLDNSILPIQGPPGTGKTYTGGGLIAELIGQGYKVGVTAVSHTVIQNLLNKSTERGKDFGIELISRHCQGSKFVIETDDDLHIKKDQVLACLDECHLVGATTFTWADETMEGALDYLFVDEAGQISLANVLAISRCASNIVLLGDPQQLQQPQRAAHPEGSDVSALSHLLDGHKTMPADKGIFLGTTYRLNSRLNAFNSDQYYEGRLTPATTAENHRINGAGRFAGQGYFYIPCEHEGNQSKSTEEAECIAGLIRELLTGEYTWTNSDGIVKKLTRDDILIVAPYNSQVFGIRNTLHRAGFPISVGTVDKFQGQEKPVVIYSMASSSVEDAPRGMSFLFDPHRVNVATSRAKCICILVCSPKLLEAECRGVEQMRLGSGICYLNGLAKSD